ncbi:MAG: hypothetical protein CTY33_02730 [Methylotenera sp.]|nr:MAG: hypothetical protein CTY33_02730 [Methylotenera sp.]
MDNDTILLLARFTIQARKLIGAIDSNLLANDETYRNQVFQKIDAQAEEELLLLSLTLRNKLGALGAVKTVEEPAPRTDNVTDKYKFGARG